MLWASFPGVTTLKTALELQQRKFTTARLYDSEIIIIRSYRDIVARFEVLKISNFHEYDIISPKV